MKKLLLAIVKTGGGSLITMLFGAVTIKMIAIITGTQGIGLWSIIKQIQQTGVVIGSVNGNISLVRGVSALDGVRKFRFMRTVMTSFFIFGLITTITLIVFSHQIAVWFKKIPSDIVILMTIPICMGIARSYVQGCLNGFRKVGSLAKSQVVGASAGAVCAYPIALLVKGGGLYGFVLLTTVAATASFFAAVYYLKKTDNIPPQLWNQPMWNNESAKDFLSLAGAMSVTGIFGIITLLLVKSIITRNGGLEEVGLFDASWNLGAMYVSLLLGSFGTYVLPKLSSLGEGDGQILFMRGTIKLSIILAIPLVVMVICLKPMVINIFYSQDFLPTLDMFRWMLIGDYFKISEWVFAMLLVANRYMGVLIISSVLWDGGLLLSVWLCYKLGMGIEMIGLTIMLLHTLTLGFHYLFIHKKIGFILPIKLVIVWLLGLMLVIMTSMINWESIVVHWGNSAMMLLVACGIAFSALEIHDKRAIVLMIKGRIGKT